MSIITLTTDFGTRDSYVAAMKGVILSIAPDVRIVDVSHETPAHHVGHGAFVLRQIWDRFPPGAIHVAVVDPGVGSDRRIIAGQYEDRFIVAPDNGLITWVHRDFRVQAIHTVEDRRYFLSNPSNTFHGRDVMAPVAAHLALGTSASRLGRPLDSVQLLDIPRRARRDGDGFTGDLIYVDRFGNLITNIHRDQLGVDGSACGDWVVVVNGKSIGKIHRTFSDVDVGVAVGIIGSAGFVEVCVREGDAAAFFDPAANAAIEVRPN